MVPIVFANVTDPVGQGFVASLSHPGGNVTGFALFHQKRSSESYRDCAGEARHERDCLRAPGA